MLAACARARKQETPVTVESRSRITLAESFCAEREREKERNSRRKSEKQRRMGADGFEWGLDCFDWVCMMCILPSIACFFHLFLQVHFFVFAFLHPLSL